MDPDETYGWEQLQSGRFAWYFGLCLALAPALASAIWVLAGKGGKGDYAGFDGDSVGDFRDFSGKGESTAGPLMSGKGAFADGMGKGNAGAEGRVYRASSAVSRGHLFFPLNIQLFA